MLLKGNKNGFSLIEMLTAISIVGILLVLAFPSYQNSNISNRLIAETNQMSSIFSFARSEAFRRNDFVSICASKDGSSCNSTDFATGSIIFSNPSQSGLSSNAQILKVYDSWIGNDKGKITVSNGGSIYTFNAIPSAVSAGSVLICSSGIGSFTLNLNSIGSLKVVHNSGDGGC